MARRQLEVREAVGQQALADHDVDVAQGVTIAHAVSEQPDVDPAVAAVKVAVAAGVDILVATGFDEGGTVSAFAVVPMVVDAAGDVPVMAAGGIVDARTAKAAFALGAEGVYVGTAFLMAEESRMAPNIKHQALAADADDMLFYRTYPAYYRSLPGELPNKLQALSDQGASRDEIFAASHRGDGARLGMLLGDLSQGYASLGLGISQIHEIKPVAEVVADLAKGCD